MCGIIGVINKEEKISKKHARLMLNTLMHRGPDGEGTYYDEKIFLGHVRLSIQDLTESGKQPMWDDQEEIGITFNGEIYNFNEIKKELNEFNFKSKTDTEVIIYAYKKWGLKKALQKFNGMFSFCLYDKRINKCFLVRDRLGVKPLVYYYNKKQIVFASELKSILKYKNINKEINHEALFNYLIYRYVPNPATIFQNIFKLEPGHILEIQLDTLRIKKQKYWDISFNKSNKLKEKEILKKINYLLEDSVKLRLISDVPVGTFLSGGIDSSLLSAIIKKTKKNVKAFTIDLVPKKYSEIEFAQNIANKKNIELISKKVGKKEFEKEYNKILNHYDEPIADSSIIPTYILCKFVKEKKFKCIISGDGGDEIFYGYSWYKNFNYLEKFKIIDKLPKRIKNVIQKYPYLKYFYYNEIERYRRIMFDRFNKNEINHLFNLNTNIDETNLIKKVLNKNKISTENINLIDLKTFMVDDILYKVDIASMANGIEVRSPFLDYRFIELTQSIPKNILFKNFELKYLLKKISKKYIPKENIYRKKKGFSAPVMEWINKDFKLEILNGNLINDPISNKKNIINYLKTEKNQGKLWQLYILEKWYSNYFEK